MFILTWLATVVLPFTKLTFLIFYTQLFRPFKWLRILCYLGMGVTSICFLGFLIAQLALAIPHPGSSFLDMVTDPREKILAQYLSIPFAATSFAIDIYIVITPLLGVAKLRLSARRKLGVVLMFMTGLSYGLPLSYATFRVRIH